MTERDGGGGESPLRRLGELLSGFRRTQLVYVAAELGVADVLQDGPKRGEEVAAAVGADPQALHRVLRGLVLLGVLREADRIALTPVGEPLRLAAQPSPRGAAVEPGGSSSSPATSSRRCRPAATGTC